MDLIDWIHELPKTHSVYALVDPLAEHEPLKYWYQHAESTDAWPLYAGTEYDTDILSGPWLLPLVQLSGWEAWWQEQEKNEQATGFLIASDASPERLVQHWKSLLKAGFDGEEVLFRFYDPRVLGPMLFTLTEDETRRFLGPTNEIVVWYQGEWVMASPYPERDMTEHVAPWWRMRAQHFVGQPGQESVVVENIEEWLWQNYPTRMRQWLKINPNLQASLSESYRMQQSESIPVLWQPGWILLHLFGYQDLWSKKELFIRIENTDEQTDLMVKVMKIIDDFESKNSGC